EQGNQQALVDLARSEEALQQPPLTLSLLGNALVGNVLEGTGAVEPAEALLRQAWQRHPGDFWTNHHLAEVLYRARLPGWEEALGLYRAAVALRPQSPGAHYNLGNTLNAKGRLEEAIAAYREAIRLKKDYPEAHYNLGNALGDKGRLEEAIAAYREA